MKRRQCGAAMRRLVLQSQAVAPETGHIVSESFKCVTEIRIGGQR